MSKYEYGFEEWSQDTRRYTLKCDRKLTRDEVNDAVYEIVGEIHDDETEHKIPLDDGTIVMITYHGNEFDNPDIDPSIYGEPDHLYWKRGEKDTENTWAIDTVFIKEDTV